MTKLLKQLALDGYPMKKQQLYEYFCDDPELRVEPKFALGTAIVAAAAKIPA